MQWNISYKKCNRQSSHFMLEACLQHLKWKFIFIFKMKIYLIFCLLVCASALHEEVLKAQWESYKAEHGKDYHPSVEEYHFNNFLQSTITIEEHNTRYHRGEVGYKLGHNKYSDLSHEDLKRRLFGRKKIKIEGYYNFTEMPSMSMTRLPKKVDWRKNLTSVKDQGFCGSCYAFATIAAVESAYLRKTNQSLDLAEQHVVDCSFKIDEDMNDGCDGGHEVVTMDYISKNGITTEDKYPYVSGEDWTRGMCRRKKNATRWGKGLKKRRIPRKNEKILARALATYGPLIISISGENADFTKYSRGIYDRKSCSKKPDHVALLVGYGTAKGRDYWLIKNSWGTSWGNRGYGRLLRGVNQCGIASEEAWAVYF